MRSRIAGIAVLLALAVGSSACVIGRIPRSLGNIGIARQARAISAGLELPGREIEGASFRRCGVNQSKYFDSYYCESYVARFTVVPGWGESAYQELSDQLSRDGWEVGSWYWIIRGNFKGRVTIPRHLQVPPAVRGTPHAERVDRVMSSLGPGESLLGVVVSFQTPTDVLRSRVCYFPC